MVDVNYWGQRRNDFYRANVRMAVCCAVISGVMIPWGSCVKAEELTPLKIGETANVIVDVESPPLDVQTLESSSMVEATGKQSSPVDTDPDVSNVVDLDTRQGDQESQLALAGSRDMQSLDVVDTGASVEFPQAVGDMGAGIDEQKTNVDAGVQPVMDSIDVVDKGGLLEAGQNAMIEQVDQSLVTADSAQLSVAGSSGDFRADDSAAVLPSGQLNEVEGRQPLQDAANEVASEESASLPYAVVLALLALIGLVPVARRNDQHHV